MCFLFSSSLWVYTTIYSPLAVYLLFLLQRDIEFRRCSMLDEWPITLPYLRTACGALYSRLLCFILYFYCKFRLDYPYMPPFDSTCVTSLSCPPLALLFRLTRVSILVVVPKISACTTASLHSSINSKCKPFEGCKRHNLEWCLSENRIHPSPFYLQILGD